MEILITLLITASLRNIVPLPEKIEEKNGTFLVSEGVYSPLKGDIDTYNLVTLLGNKLNLPVNKVPYPLGGIVFKYDKELGKEAYKIDITRKKLTIFASGYRGFLHAYNTLLQLLPDEASTGYRASSERWEIPCGTIEDSPKYEHRGLMVDVARHFFSVNEIKRVIRAMALYKLNVLHLHLNDDQGWRIAIDRYPQLTKVGAFRNETCIGHHLETYDGVRYGGFYTKNDIREIVQYAWRYGIDVMPEIDLPGHAIAALASYPELGCGNAELEVRKRWVHTKEAMCLGKESTYKWIFHVFDEVADLFPFKFIHIGGDECETDHWKSCPDCQKKIASLGLTDTPEASKENRLQQYLTNRLSEHLWKKGKTTVGWNEIIKAEEGLHPNTVVMEWNNKALGRKAATKGYRVIYADHDELYFNRAQSGDLINEPLAYLSKTAVTLRDTYSADPTMGLEGSAKENVIGVQASLWSEYIDQNWLLEYMMFPRLMALAELGWCDPSTRDYDRFTKALRERQFSLLEALNYPFRGKLWYQKEISVPPEEKADTSDRIVIY